MLKRGAATRLGRSLVAGLLALVLLATAAPDALATSVTPSGVDGVQHILDCFGALLHDPVAHHSYCGEGPSGPGPQLVPTTPGGSFATTCPTVGEFDRAGGDAARLVASLADDGLDRTPPSLHPELLRHWTTVACIGGCFPCSGPTSERASSAPIEVASLERDLDGIGGRPPVNLLQFACCPG